LITGDVAVIINEDINRQTLLQITPALQFISQNYMNTIKVSTLAYICYTSDRNLRRLFYKSLSLSPVEYVIKFRIKMASVLLSSTTDSMLEVSNKVGFSSLSSFNRHFKTIIGMSPLQWRKNNRNL
jgi:transcriptional regulator GlxA family with amidase domain